ncbi:hypothetical protein L0657_10385 [Dyadobacter sp. CY345]|uniref:hypothetical protein n=1 Tax=Dyadobacter sp. CY345 TaxID=2909335 RepID=UPI001F27ACE3|nr:hypothetical protein [Dyadobacter sp. CY345]MCF2444364.1 hypothetical protein [Dyadobacter sp. CY345]
MHHFYIYHTRINRNWLKVALILLSAYWFTSCGDSSTEPVNSRSYFPLSIGVYQIYDVKEEVYSSGQTGPSVKTWQERDEVVRETKNANGISTFIISRYSRNTATDSWLKVKEYSIEQFPDKLILNIDNQITVPFIFPIDSKLKWNGNMYNTLDSKEYRYEEIDQPLQSGNLSFEKGITVVEQSDTTSVITYSLGIKRYGLDAGLIYDEQASFEYCQSTPDCIGQGIVDSGSRKIRTIVEFGGLQ